MVVAPIHRRLRRPIAHPTAPTSSASASSPAVFINCTGSGARTQSTGSSARCAARFGASPSTTSLSPEDHAWLDELTRECATDFAAAQGYDLRDYIHGGCVADWWGFTWMILAEARGVLTPEKRFAAWCRHGETTWWARR
jgi:hypothetical protein